MGDRNDRIRRVAANTERRGKRRVPARRLEFRHRTSVLKFPSRDGSSLKVERDGPHRLVDAIAQTERSRDLVRRAGQIVGLCVTERVFGIQEKFRPWIYADRTGEDRNIVR